jgi:HEAT repeat protein
VQALDDDVGAVRYAAAEALGKIGDTAAVPHLLQRLNQKDFGALGPLIESLANLKSVQAISFSSCAITTRAFAGWRPMR